MPTYDYVCQGCGHEFELFQQMSDAVKRKCPKCGQNKLQRQIGAGAGVLFKGSGFYETDYRSDSYKKAAEAEKKSTTEKKKEGTCACGGSGPCQGGGANAAGSGESKKESKPMKKSAKKSGE